MNGARPWCDTAIKVRLSPPHASCLVAWNDHHAGARPRTSWTCLQCRGLVAGFAAARILAPPAAAATLPLPGAEASSGGTRMSDSEVEEVDDRSSSSASSSDIEGLFRKVRRKKETRRRRRDAPAASLRSPGGSDDNAQLNADDESGGGGGGGGSSSSSSSDEDVNGGDDESSEDGGREERYAAVAAAGRRIMGAKKRSVESELTLLERRRALEKRRLGERERGDGDSDSDDDVVGKHAQASKRRDRNGISIVMESTVDEGEAQAEPATKGEVIAVNDDSASSDDDEVQMFELPQSEVLTELAKAAAALQKAQQSTPDESETIEAMDLADTVPAQPALQQLPTAGPSTATIPVVVVAERECPGSVETFEPKSLYLSVNLRVPLSVLTAQVLESLGLSPGAAIVQLTSSERQTLYPRHTAESYRLYAGCTVHAKVLLKGLDAGSSSHQKAHQKKKALGRALTLLLRRPNGDEVAVKVHAKQPLATVLDRLRQQVPTLPTQLSLKFDGDLLDLQQTPEALDMESDDIVDVVEK